MHFAANLAAIITEPDGCCGVWAELNTNKLVVLSRVIAANRTDVGSPRQGYDLFCDSRLSRITRFKGTEPLWCMRCEVGWHLVSLPNARNQRRRSCGVRWIELAERFFLFFLTTYSTSGSCTAGNLSIHNKSLPITSSSIVA